MATSPQFDPFARSLANLELVIGVFYAAIARSAPRDG
jgi:hypothetical protein